MQESNFVFETDMQGIEIEFQQISKSNPKARHEDVFGGRLGHIHSGYHQDDGKVELSSSAHKSLGELEEELKAAVSAGLSEMYKSYYPVTIGCPPFFSDYASGHIHTSVKNMNSSTWVLLRQKLFSSQPLINLLSQNSPIVNGVFAADVRMVLSSWSSFTDYDSANAGHWLSIAYGRRGATIENRIPSSGPLFQILAVAALLRVIIEDDCIPMPMAETERNWHRTIKYGSSAIWEVSVPKNVLRFDGCKYEPLTARATDVWKYFYEANEEKFDKTLSSLSANMRNQIKDFYRFVAEGHTLSDAYFDLMCEMMPKRDNKIAETLYKISALSYSDGNVFDILSRNPRNFTPVIEKFYSIDEVIDIVNKPAINDMANKLRTVSNDLINSFFSDRVGIADGMSTNILIQLRNNNQINSSYIEENIIKKLKYGGIIKVNDDGNITKGENFDIAIALAKEGGLL